MANKAELEAVVSADDKPFDKAMDRVDAKAKKTAHSAEGAFSGLKDHLGEIFAVGAAVEAGKAILEFGGQIQDASDRLDLAVESVQGLGSAFSQSGAGQEVFEKGMVKLNQSIQEARDGSDKLEEAFMTLGVTWVDIRDKNPEEILYLIADGMKTAKDSTAALSAAMEVLGKAGSKLIPGLKGGSDALKELSSNAAKLSKDDVAALDDIGDAAERMWLKVKVYGAKAALFIMEDLRGEHTPEGKLLKASNAFGEGYSGAKALFPGDTGFKANEEPIAAGTKGPHGRAFTKEEEEFADDINKKEEDAAQAAEKSLEYQRKLYEEISRIEDETAYTILETSRIGMSSTEMIKDLEKERAYWVGQAAFYERDIFQSHTKEAALARQRVAKLDQQISNAPRDIEEETFTNSPRGRKMTAEEEKQVDLNMNYGAFKNFKTGPFAGGGGLTTGGLTTGSLESSGLNGGAHGAIRRGDAALKKAADAAASKEKDSQKEANRLLGSIDKKLD